MKKLDGYRPRKDFEVRWYKEWFYRIYSDGHCVFFVGVDGYTGTEQETLEVIELLVLAETAGLTPEQAGIKFPTEH